MITKKINNKIVSTLLLVFCVSLISTTCLAATYYVDKGHPSANDANIGSETKPFKTVQRAVDKAIAGDNVIVKAGTYYEYVKGYNSGTKGAPITFKSYGTDTVTIDGSNGTGGKLVVFNQRNYIIWDGIDVRNGSAAGAWFEGENNIIQNAKFYNNGTPGGSGHTGLTVIESNQTTIRNNEFFNNGWNGLNVEKSSNSTIEYNIARDNTDHVGIQAFLTNGTPFMMPNNHIRFNISYNNQVGIHLRYQENNEVSNNLVFNNSKNGIVLARMSGDTVYAPYEGHTKILNNTLSNNGSAGISNQWGTHITIKNNIIANESVAIYDERKSVNHNIDNNLYYNNTTLFKWGSTSYSSLSSIKTATGYEGNGILANPLFKDINKNDYSLNSGSPAIDAGEDLTDIAIAPLMDLEGKPRPQNGAFDIGAYEYGASVSAPLNLRIVQ